MKSKSKKKVVLGLSGGVDSSAAAVLLKEQGFLVIGVFINFFKEGRCCNTESEQRAREVCRKLEIPFYVINEKKEFKDKVIDDFVKGYKKGETPNPCVVCNRMVKIRSLIENLSSLGGDLVATGHYARVAKRNSKEWALLQGKDKKKDQSYFLWRIKKEWLSKIIFPLGEKTKEEAIEIAGKKKLSSCKAKESQEACFVNGSLTDFLKEKIPSKMGDIIDNKGQKIGEHEGAFYYTIGQRKGLGLSGGPYYVLQKDTQKNILLVTKDRREIYQKEVFFRDENFFREMCFPFKVKAKIRYNGKKEGGEVGEKKITFLSPQKAIAPGQSIVFYRGEELLGGGIITK